MSQPKEKKILLTVGNCRVKEYDSMNVVIERYEKVYNPIEKVTTTKWRFKGYSRSVMSALLFIHEKELLIDNKHVRDLKTYLEQVEKATAALLGVMKE